LINEPVELCPVNIAGLRPTDDVDVAEMQLLPKALAKLGPAVLLIDHVVKEKQSRGRYATGSQHKLSGITGAAYTIEPQARFAIGTSGSSVVLIVKDRPGGVRGHTHKVGSDRMAIGLLP
jgi:hypothetical protein